MIRTLSLLLLFSPPAFSQKTPYIPAYLLDQNTVDGAQFSWSKTAQSANFTLIWGNTVGTNPAAYPDPDLAFIPADILDTMEYIYAAFKQLGFVDEAPGTKISQYKIPIVMYNTWGPNGAQGFANGGDADGVIGAFWVHPHAMHDGGVAAHELAHSLQAQSVIDYRSTHGLGPVWLNAGIFWETHGNFMRNLLYPKAVSAWGMDVYHLETWGDWKNTYENYEMLYAIMASEGIDMVNRLWRESYSNEYPLQAYKRLAGYNQSRFNDSLFHYARRMATFDFPYNNTGAYFRQYRNADLSNYLPSIQATYSILKKIPGTTHRYEMPVEQAPEEFAYNLIPLYPDADSCAVIVKFRGHTDANAHAGWRYGFVATHPNGTISRYSPTYGENTGEINFRLQGDETKLFLVVMGAPFDNITTNPSNDTWHGYPKHFRFPYELSISGAQPEGFQAPAAFRAQLKSGGHLHANGGGWVQNSANVAASVYVGPAAMVLGNAQISGQVRIENTALVKNAVLSGQVKVLDNAFVNGGNYSQNARVQGHGFAENVTMSGNALIGMRARVTNYHLSGTVEVGGDVVVYNQNGNCNNGVHYRLTNYYDDKLLECDGRTANHPVNQDVNNSYTSFSNGDMALQCQCAYETSPITVDSIAVTKPSCSNSSGGAVAFYLSHSCGPFQYAWSSGSGSGGDLNGLAAGDYSFTITDALDRQIVQPVAIPAPPALAASISATAYDCTSGTGGVAGIVIANGTSPFLYGWNNGATEASPGGLGPGTYSVTATDALGCTFSGSVDIPLSGRLATSLGTTPIHCHDSADGSATVTVLNGIAPYNWLWQGGETAGTLSNLDGGDYAVTVTDALGCMDSLEFTLNVPAALSLQLSADQVSCFGLADGSASVGVTGGTPGYQYHWSNQDTIGTTSGLAAGIYTITVTDTNGCSAADQVVISAPPVLTASLSVTSYDCTSGMGGVAGIVMGNGTGPFLYEWNNGASDASPGGLVPGTYTVTATDALGCTFSGSVDIPVSGRLPTALSTTPVQCHDSADGTATLTVLNGVAPYNWLWQGGETTGTLSNLGGGDYAVTVIDAFGCMDSLAFTLDVPTVLSLQPAVEQVSCFGLADGSASVTAFGGTPDYQYFWSNLDTLAATAGLIAGIYTVTVVDMNGCLATAQMPVGAPAPLALTVQAPLMLCVGAEGNVVVSASGGTSPYAFLWAGGETVPVLVVPVGSYTVTVSDANGCMQIQSLNISQVPDISITAIPADASGVAASDGAVLVTDVGGGIAPFTFLWNNGDTSQSLNGVLPGDYTLSVTDAAGCVQVFSFTIDFSVSAGQAETPDFTAVVAPNPSSGQAGLWLNLQQAQSLEVSVLDIYGRILYAQTGFMPAGTNVAPMPDGLVAGMYWVTIRDKTGNKRVLRWIVGTN